MHKTAPNELVWHHRYVLVFERGFICKMVIESKVGHDPVADLYMVDAYMRWALQASEEVVGEKGMYIVLRQAGLESLINNYPTNASQISGHFTYGDYANLCASLLNFFGRAGKSMTMRIGRLSARYAVEQQSEAFGLTTLMRAARLLPLAAQQKAGLMVMQNGLRKMNESVGQQVKLSIEDRGDKFAYIDQTCTICANKQATHCICWVRNGTLIESMRWLTNKEFDIQEVACRAMGAPACVWEISKTPKASH